MRPRPAPEELSPEYLQRLAYRNRLHGLHDLMALSGTKFDELTRLSPEQLHRVFSGMRASDPGLAKDSLRSDHMVWNRLGIPSVARVCPACQRASDILDSEWSLPLSISCHQHKQLLLDTCPMCGRRIRRIDSQYQCTCGYRFADFQPDPEPAWAARYIAVFAPWRTRRGSTLSILELFDLEFGMVRLLRDLIGSNQPGPCRRPGRLPRHQKHWLFLADVPAIGKLLVDWPVAIAEALATAISVGEARRGSLRRIASTSEQLDTCFGRALEAVNAQAQAVARAKQMSRATESDSVANLVRALRVNVSTAQRLMHDPSWKARILALAHVPPGSPLISAVRSVVRTTIPFGEAAEALKSPRMLLAALALGGYLPHVRCGEPYCHMRFWQKDIGELIERLRALTRVTADNELQVVRLVDLPVGRSDRSAALPRRGSRRLIAWILSGEAPLLALREKPETLRDFALPLEYVRRVLHWRLSIPSDCIILFRPPEVVR